jgi:hypothetical protein
VDKTDIKPAELRDPNVVWYGPHSCENCGGRVVRQAIESGGLYFDAQPDERIIYPSVGEGLDREWTAHVCRTHASAAAEPVATPAAFYQVDPRMTREAMAEMRKKCGMDPATFNYADPTPEMHGDPVWEAIWNEIKTWDVNVPTEYVGYEGATGNHVTAIYLAIKKAADRG